MNEVDALASLIAGTPATGSGRHASMMRHVRSKLVSTATALLDLRASASAHRSLIAPGLARGLFELSYTALLARLDPIRVLFVVGLQEQPTYTQEQSYQISIHWSGDIVAEAVKNLWSDSQRPGQMTRALLGDYLDHLVWREAFDAVTPDFKTGTLCKDLANLTSIGLVPALRGRSSRLYSTFSKGIHYEHYLPSTAQFDASTLTQTVGELVATLAQSGVVLSHCEWALLRPSPDDLREWFDTIKDLEVTYE